MTIVYNPPESVRRDIPITSIERLAGDDGRVRYAATLSTDAPIMRWGVNEVLVHRAEAVNMERARDGLPLLLNHNRDELLGVVRNVRLDGDRLRGEIEFDSEDDEAKRWESKISRGLFSGALSIGASIEQYKRIEDDDGKITYHLTRWTPLETSLATVPADARAGIGRQYQEPLTMSERNDAPTGTNTLSVVTDAQKAQAAQQGAKAERERVSQINAWIDTRSHQGEALEKLRREAIDGDYQLPDVYARYADLIDTDQSKTIEAHRPPVYEKAAPTRAPFVEMGRDAAEGWQENVQHSLMIRAGLLTPDERKKLAPHCEYVHRHITSVAADYLQRIGRPIRGLTDADIIGEALVTRNIGVGQTASDFTDILANVAEKAAGVGYDETPETWRAWCRTGTLPDFKQAKRVNLSAFSDLDEVPDGGSYQVGKFSDVAEPIQAKEYAKNWVISRQALINDDIDVFTRVPQGMGRAAARKVGDVVYITTLYGAAGVGPTLTQDSVALFATGHSNYVPNTSGAPPSVATVNAAYTAMAKQTDPSGEATLGLTPRYMIVPAALRSTAMVLRNSMQDPAEGSTTSFTAANPFYQAFEVVVDARLDGLDANYWYMAADPSQVDTVEVAFLRGAEAPVIRQEEQISRSGVTFLVRLDFAVAALDFRGLYLNDGN